jgi:hypothetical protein
MKTPIFIALLAAAPLAAQTVDEQAGYTAIGHTSVGALAPMLTNTLLNRLQNGASLALRYGNRSRGDLNRTTNAAVVTGVLPAGLGSSITVSAGVVRTERNSILAQSTALNRLTLGVGGDVRLVGSAMGNTATSPMMTVSLDGELGYTNMNPGSAFSGYVGLPLALVQRGTGMQFSPFITPGFAIGRISTNTATNDGTGLMLGGGLGIYNTESGVVVNLGAQHQFLKGASTSVGINVLVGGK